MSSPVAVSQLPSQEDAGPGGKDGQGYQQPCQVIPQPQALGQEKGKEGVDESAQIIDNTSEEEHPEAAGQAEIGSQALTEG